MRHYSIHRESRSLCSCLKCGERVFGLKKRMKSYSNQSENQIILEQTPEGNQELCRIDNRDNCNRNSCNSSDSVKHRSKQTANKSFSCHFSYCDYKTSNKNNLKVHRKSSRKGLDILNLNFRSFNSNVFQVLK